MSAASESAANTMVLRFSILIATLALVCCSTPVPSLIERMPPSVPRYAEEEALERPDPMEDRDPAGKPSRTRLVIRATIQGREQFLSGMPIDAFVPHEAFSFVATFRIDEIIEGDFPRDEIRIVVRNPLVQFAFPESDQRQFTLTLLPASGKEYHLIDIEPPGSVLWERERKKRERENLEKGDPGS